VATELHLDNPAGRLHYTLERFATHRDIQIVQSWASALEVEEANVPRALIGVQDLIDDTKRAYQWTGTTMFSGLPDRLDEVRTLLFHPAQPWTAAVSATLPADWDFILRDLRNVSHLLHERGMQSNIPDQGDIAEMIETVRRLIVSVTESDLLPPDLKELLLHQLSQALATLEKWWVHGPDKIRLDVWAVATTVAAAERVMDGQPTDRQRTKKMRLLVEPIKNWAAVALVAFSVINSGALTIGTVEHALGLSAPAAATQVDVKVELEQPPSPSLPADTDGDPATPGEGAPNR
jgi:hypothetical protein